MLVELSLVQENRNNTSSPSASSASKSSVERVQKAMSPHLNPADSQGQVPFARKRSYSFGDLSSSPYQKRARSAFERTIEERHGPGVLCHGPQASEDVLDFIQNQCPVGQPRPRNGDAHSFLGVSRTASREDIQRAYKRMRSTFNHTKFNTVADLEMAQKALNVIDSAFESLRPKNEFV